VPSSIASSVQQVLDVQRRHGNIPAVSFHFEVRIAMRRGLLTVLVVIVLGAVVRSQPSQASAPIDKYATVHGVKLHYIDWGGSGETLFFLTPLGGELVEQFGAIAPQFTDRFRVLGVTRRGAGDPTSRSRDTTRRRLCATSSRSWISWESGARISRGTP
jgi:hypothetical protein